MLLVRWYIKLRAITCSLLFVVQILLKHLAGTVFVHTPTILSLGTDPYQLRNDNPDIRSSWSYLIAERVCACVPIKKSRPLFCVGTLFRTEVGFKRILVRSHVCSLTDRCYAVTF
ncbi:hypothetical protein GGS21DRAFT_408506 [Xylaria nigripes]|nr:hypothetical protein GGS21DRAFT_408506 [Xylaria nigripes]